MSPSQAAAFTSSLIGKSYDDLTFRTFKQWACEGKILLAHSKTIQKSLHLSDTASNTFDATLLLHFTQLFKMNVWKIQCENQVKWECEHAISRKDKCIQASDTNNEDVDNDEGEIHSDNIIECHRPNTFSLNVQPILRDTPGSSQLQILDDIDTPV